MPWVVISLRGHSPTQRLIYPLPERHGLGIHLTIDLDGKARFGPDVLWSPKINTVQDLETQLDYTVDLSSKQLFMAAIQTYWPSLSEERLVPNYAGMRVKVKASGQGKNDFVLLGPKEHGVEGLIHVLGVESPGLTSALAIGEWIGHSLRTNPLMLLAVYDCSC